MKSPEVDTISVKFHEILYKFGKNLSRNVFLRWQLNINDKKAIFMLHVVNQYKKCKTYIDSWFALNTFNSFEKAVTSG